MRPAICRLSVLLLVLAGPASPADPGDRRDDPDGQYVVDTLTARFRFADANGDGQLDPRELAVALRGPVARRAAAMAVTYPGRYPDIAFLKRYDLDGSRTVSRREFGLFAQSAAAFEDRKRRVRAEVLAAHRQLFCVRDRGRIEALTASITNRQATLAAEREAFARW